MDFNEINIKQKEICDKYGAPFSKIDPDEIIGISDGITQGLLPVNGLRHPANDTTTGWYIWAGDYSEDDDFFKPIHAKHAIEKYPHIAPYLGLNQGWRFLIDPVNHHEDIWEDPSLLKIT